MEVIFAYGAGLLTLINPCVLPVLPIVLASALQADRLGPLALAAGMAVSFVVLGVGVAALGHSVGLSADTMARAGAVAMVLFGLVLLVPRASASFAAATAGVSAGADARMDKLDHDGVMGQFLGGILLGAVWSPCVGPTLGGAIALASQGEDLLRATVIMASFSLGVGTFIVAIAYGLRGVLGRNQAALQRFARTARPFLGAVFVITGVVLFFRFHYVIEGALLDVMPVWLQDLSVAL